MNRTGKSKSPWAVVDRFSARCYGLIRQSFLGRWMTAYQRLNRRMRGGEAIDRPLTGFRQKVVRATEKSPIVKLFQAVAQALFDMPIAVVGLFGLMYGLSGAGGLLIYNVYLLSEHVGEMDMGGIMRYVMIVLFSCPLLFSGRPLSETLYRCGLTRIVLIWLLGVPKDRFLRPARPMWRGLPVVAAVLALGTGIWSSQLGRFEAFDQMSSLWYPLLVPLGILFLVLFSMILTVPETGVVLACGCLPLLWLRSDWPLFVLLGLIATTWLGLLVQLLQAHRTLRFDLLDRMVLLFGGVMLLGGMIGYGVDAASVQRALLLVGLLSLYFLIVNLMVTRTHVKRCWVGVVLMSLLVTASMLARYINPEELRWAEDLWYRAGPVVADEFAGAVNWLSAGALSWQVALLVMALPVTFAFLMRGKRLLWQTLLSVMLVVDLALVLLSGSRGAVIALLVGVLLFALLSHHRTLTVGVFAAPVVGGVCLCMPLMPEAWVAPVQRFSSWMSSWGGLYADRYWEGIWGLIKAHPAGIGFGADSFESLYPLYATTAVTPGGTGSLFLNLLVTLGIPGLLVFGAVIFFFIQKSLTALRYAGGRADRVMILGGMVSLVSVLLMGCTRSLDTPAIFVGFWMILAILSTYVNIVVTETEALRTQSMGTVTGQDYVGRVD